MSHSDLYVVTIHPSSHSNEEIILNAFFYAELKPNELIQIYDPDLPLNRLIVRVPPQITTQSTLEISILKPIAEAIPLVQYSKVVIDRIDAEEATLDFVELSFKRQYLQRGNMFRFKQALIGRTIHLNQNISLLGVQAQFQELKKGLNNRKSGLVTEDTKLVFRSKSSRIIWLVQISAEMWDIDPNGDMYFDKFLKEFVGPIFDSWKNLGVSHMLTVIFFARTIYLDRITRLSHPDFTSKKSVNYNKTGFYQQDFLKIVVENIADIDKVSLIKQLKHEFWAFPQILGWKIPFTNKNQKAYPSDVVDGSLYTPRYPNDSQTGGGGGGGGNDDDDREDLTSRPSGVIETAVPSDSVHGNFLGAINTSLNLLEKHYMDRDLTRTGNSIVMVSAGSGVFKVLPHLAQITKQRMLDSAFGIDFISLSRPPFHTVPLFIVSSGIPGAKDFYEMPHWMRVSYIDCKKNLENSESEIKYPLSSSNLDYDQLWAKDYSAPPTSFVLTSILTYSSSLVALKASYISHLPFALKEFLYHLCRQHGPCSRTVSSTVNIDFSEHDSPTRAASASLLLHKAGITSSSLSLTGPTIPQWGKVRLTLAEELESRKFGHSTESIIFQSDIVKLKLLSQKGINPSTGNPATTLGGSLGSMNISSTTKLLYMNLLNLVPSLRQGRGDGLAASFSSHNDGGDELDESHHSGQLAKSSGSNLSNSYEDHRFFGAASVGAGAGGGSSNDSSGHGGVLKKSSINLPPIHIDSGGYGEHIMRLDSKSSNVSSPSLASSTSAQYYQELVSTRMKINDAFSSQHMTIDSFKELMNCHDGLMNHFFSRLKPDPAAIIAAATAASAAVTSPTRSNSSNPVEGKDTAVDVSNHGNDSTSPEECHTPPPAPVFASPKKSILKNSSSALNLLGSSHPPSTVVSGSYEENKETGMREGLKVVKIEDASGNIVVTSVAPPKVSNKAAANWRMNQGMIPGKMMNDNMKTAYMNVMMGKGNPRMMFTPVELRSGGNAAVISTNSSLPSENSSNITSSKGKQAENSKDNEQDLSTSKKSTADNNANPGTAEKTATQENAAVTKSSTNTPETKRNSLATFSSSASPITVSSFTKKTKLSSKNFVARNQMVRNLSAVAAPRQTANDTNHLSDTSNRTFTVHHGKIIPLPGIDNTKQKENEIVEYLNNYATQYSINPFRQKDGEKYLASMTHNRRRWSHVFPTIRHEKLTDYGLNWKSLTQPAILPLNTDYLPSVKELDRNYTVHQYIVTIDKYECPFPSLQATLQELVCQRLSREFQLVEGFDKSVYFRINNYDNVIDNNKRDTFYQNFFILTMGHRIHFLLGDVDENRIYVTSFLSKKAQIPEDVNEIKESTEKEIFSLTGFHYNYEMWIANRKEFHCLSQKFYQFPKKEYLWNRLDNLITGNLDYDMSIVEDLKPRYVHFILIPKDIKTETELNEYYSKIDQFSEFINKYVPKNDRPMNIQKDRTLFTSFSSIEASSFTPPESDYWINRPMLYYKKTNSMMDAVKCSLKNADGTGGSNPNWVYINYDRHIYCYKAFHIEIQWFVCDSWLIDDFVTLIYRRCGRFGLRVVQTPGYFNSNNLNIHPYRPAPYISIPSSSPNTFTLSSATGSFSGLANAPTPQTIPSSVSSRTDNLPSPSNSSTNILGPILNPNTNATVAPAASTVVATATSTTNTNTNLSFGSTITGASFVFIPSTALRLIERIYFIHSHDWIFDNEECTKWDLIGLNIPNYYERDRDIYNDELLAPVLPQRPAGNNISAPSAMQTPKPTNSSITKSFQRLMFQRNKSGEEDSSGNFIHGTSTPPLENSSVGEGRFSRSDTIFSGFAPVPLSGSIQSLLTSNPSKKDRPENQRIDRQYVHVLGIATVRVAAQGFLWFASSTTKLSDMNMSIEEKTAISIKAMHQLELYCNIVNDIYEIVLESVDKAIVILESREMIVEIVETNLDELFRKQSQQTPVPPIISRSESFNQPVQNLSPSHSYYLSSPAMGVSTSMSRGEGNPRSPPIEPDGGLSFPFSPSPSRATSLKGSGGVQGSTNRACSPLLSQTNSKSGTNLNLDLELIRSNSETKESLTFSAPSTAGTNQVHFDAKSSASVVNHSTHSSPVGAKVRNPAPIKAYQQSSNNNSVESSSSSDDEEGTSTTTLQLVYSRSTVVPNQIGSTGPRKQSSTSPTSSIPVPPQSTASPSFQPPALP